MNYSIEIPCVTIDTSEMSERKISRLKQADDGNYYKEEPTYYQHKPYNYYVFFLKNIYLTLSVN